jgi:hypothetical protein
MAGENSLPTQYYTDDQTILVESLSAPAGAVPILYADRDLIIDSVVVGTYTASSGGASATIQKTTAATRTGTTITPAAPNATATSIMGAGTIAINAAGTVVVATDTATTYLDKTLNKLDAGNWLLFVPVSGATSLVGTVQVRFRSRPK